MVWSGSSVGEADDVESDETEAEDDEVHIEGGGEVVLMERSMSRSQS